MKNETLDHGNIQFTPPHHAMHSLEPALTPSLIRKDVIFVDQDMPLLEVSKLMRDQQIGDVIVTTRENHILRPVGIITDRDLVVEVLANEQAIETLHASDLMSAPIVIAQETDGIYDLIRLMKEKGVGRIPIVDEEGYLVGIVTSKKILQLLSQEMSDLLSIHQHVRQKLKH